MTTLQQNQLGLDPDPRYFFLDEADAVSAVIPLAWPEEAQAGLPSAVDCAREALRRWVANGLPIHRRSDGSPRFDIGHIINFMRDAGLSGRDSVFPLRTVPIFRRQAAEAMDLVHAGADRGGAPARQFRVHIRREFNVARLPHGKPLRLRMPLPYDDPTQTLLDVSITPPHGAVATRRTANWIETKLPPIGALACRTIVLEARFQLSALQTRGSFGDGASTGGAPDPTLYLNPSESLIQVTPAVRHLAAELAPAGPADVQATLAAFWDFFHTGGSSSALRLGYVRHSELDRADPLADLIQRGWFDCYSGSSLFIALCRAVKIPARLVHGLMLHEMTPAFHFWAEIHVGPASWLPIDLASWDYAEGRPGLEPWSRLFLGRLDPRMKLECYPRTVTGPTGTPFPAAWSVLRTPVPGGLATTVYDAETAEPAYQDAVRVIRLD